MAAVDAGLANALIGAVKAVDPGLILVAPAYSVLLDQTRAAGLKTVCEVFADRTYDDAGQLTSRKMENAVIHDFNQSVDHVLRMVMDGEILTTSGKRLQVEADTICVHGDTPGAVDIAKNMRGALEEAGVAIRAFGT